MSYKNILFGLFASIFLSPCFAATCADYAGTCWVNYDFMKMLAIGVYNRNPIDAGRFSFDYNGSGAAAGTYTLDGQCVENTDGTVTLHFADDTYAITVKSAGNYLEVVKVVLGQHGSYDGPIFLNQTPTRVCGVSK